MNKRAAGLSEEITQRRQESASHPKSEPDNAQLGPALATGLTDLAQVVPDRRERANVQARNPNIAIKYHTFCRDLDELLDSFRARVANTKPIQH